MTGKENAPDLARDHEAHREDILHLNNNQCLTTKQQRQIVLDYLLRGNHLTMRYARQVLGVMHHAGRVEELIAAGWNIVTHYTTATGEAGKKHRQGAYVLFNNDEAA